MYIYVLYVGVYVCSIERSMDLDTVPKTEKLDTQFVSTRPKMPHNPPSRSHIVSISMCDNAHSNVNAYVCT